ncbi:hypothetical protein BDR05DRAFT_999357 [Suillus weaverae]|nr:hypothetical protein BDR05DRAFT_999357 [Suillus weaverae]
MAGMNFKELKFVYNTIEAYHNKSGCHWDNNCGANIEGSSTEAVWDEYVSKKTNVLLKPFKTIGWPYFSMMEQILPRHSSAQDTTTYHSALSAQNDQLVISTSSTPYNTDVSMSAGGLRLGAICTSMRDADPMGQPCVIPDLTPIGTSAQVVINWGAPPPIPPFAGHSSDSMNVGPPTSSIPMSSGSSTGKHSHSEVTHGQSAPPHSAPPSTVWTSVSQMTKLESEKKPRLSTASGKMHPSAPKSMSKKNVQDTANTAVLMNLQGTINCLSDFLNMNFNATDEAHTADHQSCTQKMVQSSMNIMVDEKVLLMHVLMGNMAACDTIIGIEDPELLVAFLHLLIICARQEDPTL